MTPVVLQVLLALAEHDSYAYQLMKEIESRTDHRVRIGPGSLHFTLSRLLERGWIAEARGPGPDQDRRRKYYRLTPGGKAVLLDELDSMASIVDIARRRALISPGS